MDEDLFVGFDVAGGTEVQLVAFGENSKIYKVNPFLEYVFTLVVVLLTVAFVGLFECA